MKTYGLPIALWVTSVVGLVMMLMLDGELGDWAGLVLLSLPLVVVLRYGLMRQETSRP